MIMRVAAVLILWTIMGAKAYNLYRDANQPVPARVENLLGRMTLAEKIPQLFASQLRPAKLVSTFGGTHLGLGAASMMSFSASEAQNISGAVALRNSLQAMIMAGSRHGIPVSFHTEALHGGAYNGTVFPMPVLQACSWNTTLAEAIGAAIAVQARAVGADVAYAPVINMWTDPRFGRLQEGFSENPTISSRMGAAYALGLQGPPTGAESYLATAKVIALAKHYAAYGAASGGLNAAPADISNRTLHDVYLRPWRAFTEAGGRGVMSAHNTIAGVPCHANRWLINQRLRVDYGFGQGITVSDCNDIGVLVDYGFAANISHAAALALKAGVDYDLQCGQNDTAWAYYQGVATAVESGLLAESDVDVAVRHVLTAKFAAGLFERPMTDVAAVNAALLNPAHAALARNAAAQSIVLLINGRSNDKPFLPIDLAGSKAPRRIAVLGPLATSVSAILGSYTLYSGNDQPVALLPEVLALAAPAANVTYLPGAEASGPPGQGSSLIPAAVQLARSSDLAVLVLGDDSDTCGEWSDRDSLDLPGGQQQLLNAVLASGTPTIVILLNGRTMTFGADGCATPNAALGQMDALLEAWRPGQYGAQAIVDIITGVVNPSGKLAQNWPRSVGQVGSGASPWLASIRGKWLANAVGFQDKDGRRYDTYVSSLSTPLFYFGFGLSYSSFEYRDMALVPVMAGASPLIIFNVSVTLRNAGPVGGAEIVQVYAKDPPGVLPAVAFWKRLVGFTKVYLPPATSATVFVAIGFDDLAIHDDAMQPQLYAGRYLLTAGGASNDDLLAINVTLPTGD